MKTLADAIERQLIRDEIARLRNFRPCLVNPRPIDAEIARLEGLIAPAAVIIPYEVDDE